MRSFKTIFVVLWQMGTIDEVHHFHDHSCSVVTAPYAQYGPKDGKAYIYEPCIQS